MSDDAAVAGYIHDMALQLARLAAGAALPTLAHLLSMVVIEAAQLAAPERLNGGG